MRDLKDITYMTLLLSGGSFVLILIFGILSIFIQTFSLFSSLSNFIFISISVSVLIFLIFWMLLFLISVTDFFYHFWFYNFLYLSSHDSLKTAQIYTLKRGKLTTNVSYSEKPYFLIDWKSNWLAADVNSEPEWVFSLVHNKKKLFKLSISEDPWSRNIEDIKKLISFLDGYTIIFTKNARKRKERLINALNVTHTETTQTKNKK